MNDSAGNNFLEVWHQVMIVGAIASVAIAFLIYILHKIKLASIKDYKAKYDHIRNNEIKNYKIAFIVLAIGAAMLINTYGMNSLEFDPIWFFVRTFISIAGGTLVGYISSLILQYYYPTRLNKKLKKWRFMPRVNPKTGNKMRLLREDEEDVHLDEGMIAEENIFSVDYDVWIDEKTGDTKIEKYLGHLEALQCNNCGFYTMKVVREEIIKRPTETEDGELIKHYECQYCGSVRATQFNIAHEENYENIAADKVEFESNALLDGIRIEIISTTGEKKSFVFQTVEQAQKFLSEFEFEKVN